MYYSRFCITLFLCKTLPSKHLNVVSTLPFCYCDIVTWGNVKTTFKQRCVFQCWHLQCRTTSNQHLHFIVDMNNVRQSRNNVFVFNFEFHSVGKRQNNVVKMTTSKRNNNKNYFKYNTRDSKFLLLFHNFLYFTPHVKRNMSKSTCKDEKIFKRSWKTLHFKNLIKPLHFVKCQLVFNFTVRLVKVHND